MFSRGGRFVSKQYERLKALLMELFQLDQPDLDFGFYRVMHARSTEISQFLDNQLLPQVQAAFEMYRPADKTELEVELERTLEQAQELGADPEGLPKVQELRARLASSAVDVTGLQLEVFDDLYRFFRRYYSEGDFLAKRVYKPGVYAIPYEGEEIKLHWANSDQYYIKSTEHLRDYAFHLRPRDDNPLRVRFVVERAAEGEHDNVLANSDRERLFVLRGQEPMRVSNGELVIAFEFRPVTVNDWPEPVREGKARSPQQKDLITIATEQLLATTDEDFEEWTSELSKRHVTTSGELASYPRLEAHLRRFTARNTFDYFIHKNLGPFLHRELDFFIKNEVMHLDDVESASAPRVEQYLSKIKVIRSIAAKIIAFLAQLEDFQKRLWLKKKFVTSTRYLITLDHLDKNLLAEVAANEAQRREWVDLFGINEISGDLTSPPYSEPLSLDFLEKNPHLVVDTRHFDMSFTERAIASIEDFDEALDGVLVHGENLQVLNLVCAKYRGRVDCAYIDPPYNTDASPIHYKNGYKSSTWVTLMNDRVCATRPLLREKGVLVAAIDDEQQRELNFVLSEVFDGRLLGTIVVRSNPSGRPMQAGYSVSHEYLLFAGQGPEAVIRRLPPTEQQLARFSHTDAIGRFEWRNLRREGSNSDRTARPRLYYPIYLRDEELRVPSMTWDSNTESWTIDEDPRPGEVVVFPDNEAGDQKTWRWEWKTVMDSLDELAVRPDRSGKDYVYYKRRPHDEGVVSVSSWFDAKYSATEHGTGLLKAMFGRSPFSYPKSLWAVLDSIYIAGASRPGSTVIDFFAGSGTTAHAVLQLNRQYGGRRHYLLAEMGHHFESVLVPRIKKAIYSAEWSEGSPVRRDTGVSQVVKVLRLESYEDTLNNLVTHRADNQQAALTAASADLREDYLLKYVLNVETRGSQSLLNIDALADPFSYCLLTRDPGSADTEEATVDLLETFNWLIGLNVQKVQTSRRFSASLQRDSEGRLSATELVADDDGQWWFRVVEGSTDAGHRVLVIWRRLTHDLEADNAVLDRFFESLDDSDLPLGLVYVNGDNNLELRKSSADVWSVRLIDNEFPRLMFALSEES